MTGEKPMMKGEREDLKRLARERARVAKADAKARTADLKAMIEEQVATIYDFNRDDVWAAATAEAQSAVTKANKDIRARCVALGIPAELAPNITATWNGRGQYKVERRQNEIRRVAHTRLEAMERNAIHEIDKKTLAIQTHLVRVGLTSEEAIGFLDEMPEIDALMPALDLQQLGAGDPADLGFGDDDL